MQKKSKLSYFIFSLFVSAFTAIPAFAAPAFGNPSSFLIDWGSGNTFRGLIGKLIVLGLGIAGVVAMGFIIFGGYQYITSAGNEERAEAGKKTLINAIIGVVIIVLSWVIVNVVSNALARA